VGLLGSPHIWTSNPDHRPGMDGSTGLRSSPAPRPRITTDCTLVVWQTGRRGNARTSHLSSADTKDATGLDASIVEGYCMEKTIVTDVL
jgi:hypothetical protein